MADSWDPSDMYREMQGRAAKTKPPSFLDDLLVALRRGKTITEAELRITVAAAESRGRQWAVDRLRDDQRYLAWLRSKAGPTEEWAAIDAMPPKQRLAIYLESAMKEESTDAR